MKINPQTVISIICLCGMLFFLYLWDKEKDKQLDYDIMNKAVIDELTNDLVRLSHDYDSLEIVDSTLATKLILDSIQIASLKSNIYSLKKYYEKKLADLDKLTPNEHYDAITNLLNENR